MKKGVFASGLAGVFLFLASTLAQGEPKPATYVRVCDDYGAGFLYIPGTKTCMDPSTGETRWETADGTVYGETELRQRLDSIESRINKAFAEQASVAAALADPDLVAGEHFGLRVNWGNAGQANAFGFSGAAVIADHLFGDTGRLTGSGGIAFSGGTVGGRAGLQLTW